MTHVHIKNSRKVKSDEQVERYLDSNGGMRYTGVVLDQGVVDIPAVLAELDKVGYEGYVSVEYQGMDEPCEALRYNLEYTDKLLGN